MNTLWKTTLYQQPRRSNNFTATSCEVVVLGKTDEGDWVAAPLIPEGSAGAYTMFGPQLTFSLIDGDEWTENDPSEGW